MKHCCLCGSPCRKFRADFGDYVCASCFKEVNKRSDHLYCHRCLEDNLDILTRFTDGHRFCKPCVEAMNAFNAAMNEVLGTEWRSASREELARGTNLLQMLNSEALTAKHEAIKARYRKTA